MVYYAMQWMGGIERRTSTFLSTSRILVYASRYTRVARFTTSRPLTVMSVSSDKPRPIRYNILCVVVVFRSMRSIAGQKLFGSAWCKMQMVQTRKAMISEELPGTLLFLSYNTTTNLNQHCRTSRISCRVPAYQKTLPTLMVSFP